MNPAHTMRNAVQAVVASMSFEAHGLTASEYRLQGDETKYTEDALAARRALRDDKKVCEGLQRFLDTFKSQWPKAGSRAAARSSSAELEPLQRDEVVEAQLLMCKALFAPDEWNYRDARAAALEDWKREVGAEATVMSQEQARALACFCD